MTTNKSTAQRLDRLHGDFHAKTITTGDAVKAVRQLVDVTDMGALDLLTSKQSPSARYLEAVTHGAS